MLTEKTIQVKDTLYPMFTHWRKLSFGIVVFVFCCYWAVSLFSFYHPYSNQILKSLRQKSHWKTLRLLKLLEREVAALSSLFDTNGMGHCLLWRWLFEGIFYSVNYKLHITTISNLRILIFSTTLFYSRDLVLSWKINQQHSQMELVEVEVLLSSSYHHHSRFSMLSGLAT